MEALLIQFFLLISGQGLKALKIAICLWGAESNLPNDPVFLSKLTGILAFKKMARMGTQVGFFEGFSDVPCECSYLVSIVLSCCRFKRNRYVLVFPFQALTIIVSS